MAICPICRDILGQADYHHKRAAGKSQKEALRCLKRPLSDVRLSTGLSHTGPTLARSPTSRASFRNDDNDNSESALVVDDPADAPPFTGISEAGDGNSAPSCLYTPP